MLLSRESLLWGERKDVRYTGMTDSLFTPFHWGFLPLGRIFCKRGHVDKIIFFNMADSREEGVPVCVIERTHAWST